MDIEHEKEVIGDFANHLHQHGVNTLKPLNKDFMELQKKVREMIHEMLKKEGHPGVSIYDATVAFLALGAINSMTIMDSYKRPNHVADVPDEIKKDWDKIEGDWRITTIIHVFTTMVLNIRQAQMVSGSLPLDMMEPEGNG